MPEGSYPFPMYSGILEHRHYKKIGSAIWLFLWCISSTTSEKEKDGTVWGIVLGNKPVKISELEDEFGVSDRTIRSWIKTLEENQYIKVTRAPYGLIFSVRNSKKFKNRPEENFHSTEGDRQHSSDLNDRDRQEYSDHPEENFRSNKDITEINNAAVITDPETILKLAREVEDYFCMRRGQGLNVSVADFEEIKKMVATGIPLDIVKRSIDKSFAEYKPKHGWDKIRNMAYCIPRCFDEWSKSQVDESITDGAWPNRPVALGPSPQRGRRTKQQEQIDEVDRFIEEERRREAH